MEKETGRKLKLPVSEKDESRIKAKVDEAYRVESRRVFATLIRRLGDFDLAEEALPLRRIGSYTLQAAIAASHVEAADVASTDWTRIGGLFDFLMRVHPSPVVELNGAVAVAMRDGPEAGLNGGV